MQPSDNKKGDSPQKRKRGRPRKSQAEREAERERRIPESFEGRMRFRPGDPHALDVEFQEARNLRALIVEEISTIHQQLTELVDQDDPSEAISKEENALKAFLWNTYKEHKHRDHIIASFMAIRRRRLRARLQAAHTALEIAADLLTPDDKILVELRQALHQDQEPTQEEDQGDQGNDMDMVHMEEEEGSSEQRIDHRHIYGDVVTLRQRLAAFDERVKAIRSSITAGIGWFEEFYVKKNRPNPEVLPYVARNEPIPDDMPLMIAYLLGPYLKYRWRESGYGTAYTISMGRIPDDELAAAAHWAEITGQKEPDSSKQWPEL